MGDGGSETTNASNPTETGAAELRSGLTHLLQEHVYLAGIAFTQGVGQGLDSKEFEASAATLDQNSVADAFANQAIDRVHEGGTPVLVHRPGR